MALFLLEKKYLVSKNNVHHCRFVCSVCCEEIGNVFLLFIIWQLLGNAVNIAWGFLNVKTVGHGELVESECDYIKDKAHKCKKYCTRLYLPVWVGKREGNGWSEQEQRPSCAGY